MKKKIIYLHGFASSPESSTAKELRKIAEDLGYELECPELTFNPQVDLDLINDMILAENPALVIGTSLGGLYAIYCQTEDLQPKVPVLVINPVTRPTSDLKQFLGKNTFFNKRKDGSTEFYFNQYDLDKFRKIDLNIESSIKEKAETLFVVLSDRDETLVSDPHIALRSLAPGHILETSAIGHRLDKDFINTTLKNIIENILDTNDETYLNLELEEFQDLNERFRNQIKSGLEPLKYRDEIWHMLQIAYEPIGGFQGASSLEELERKIGFSKVCIKEGRIVAFTLYKNTLFGRKLVAGATDGSEEGKKWLYKIIQEDTKMVSRHAYAEVSDKLEHLYRKLDSPLVPFEIVQKIMFGKHLDQNIDPDQEKKERYDFDKNYHYYRNLSSGDRHRKVMTGHPKKLE